MMCKQRPEYWMAGLLFILISSVFGTELVYAGYEQKRQVVSGGGHSSLDATGTYRNTGTIGQSSPAGQMKNEKYTNYGGFWGRGRHTASVYYNLSVITDAGTGSGKVTGPGIDCQSDCTEAYPAGTKITLTPVADRDSKAICWKIDDPQSECVFELSNITRDITVYAIFDRCPWPEEMLNLSPPDGGTDQSLDTDLGWATSIDVTSYTVHFGTSSPPPELMSVPATSYDPGLLAGNTTYFWKVDAQNECGTVEGPEWSFTTMIDNLAPRVTLDLDHREIYLGQPATIYTSARDNGQVVEFHLTIDGKEIATAPGTQSYTPSATGSFELRASATDSEGNVGNVRKTLFVVELPLPATKTMRFYEGFDPETKALERDRTVLIFTPEMRENMSEISFAPELEQNLRFPEGVSWYFTFRNRAVVMVPTAGRQAALFTNRAFESITAAEAASAVYEEWPEGHGLGANDTVVIRRKSRYLIGGYSYVKVGHVRPDLPAMTVEFTYQQLIAP